MINLLKKRYFRKSPQRGFTPLEMATNRVDGEVANGGLIPLSAHIVNGRNSQTGFTLVEIVVASLLLAIVSAGLFSVTLSSRKIITTSSQRHTATEVAQTVLENLRAYLGEGNWSDAVSPSPIYPVDWQCYDFGDRTNVFVSEITDTFAGTEFHNKYGGRWCYKVENVGGCDYRKVTVEVNWTEIEP